MPTSAVDAISPALQLAKERLFRPFRFAQWARLALLGLATGEISSAGGCPSSSFHVPAPTTTGNASRELLPLAGILKGMDHVHLAILITGLIVAGAILLLTFLYINSISRFILFECVLTGRCLLREGWEKWQPQGRRFFIWQLLLGLVALGGLVVLIGIPAGIAGLLGMTRHSAGHAVAAGLGMVLAVLVAMAYMLVLFVITVLTKDFVVPQMALEPISAMEGWRRLLRMMKSERGSYAGYLGMKLVLAIGAAFIIGIATVIVFLITLIPTGLLTVVLVLVFKGAGVTWNVYTITAAVIAGCFVFAGALYVVAFVSVPATVFFPAYSIYFLAARYPALNAVLHPALPAPPPLPEPAAG